MIELLTHRWYHPNPVSKGKIIVNDAEGDGGVACRQYPPVQANISVTTTLTIDSISGGRLRWDIGGQLGTWRSAPGTYTESIVSSGNEYAALVYDSFTVATIDEPSLSVGIPEDGD